MSLNWLWKDKCGEATVEFTVDGETKQHTVNLYEGNASSSSSASGKMTRALINTISGRSGEIKPI